MSRVLFVTMCTGYCGSDNHQLISVPEGADDDYISSICWEMAVENASAYGYELCDEECEDEECEMEHPRSTNIEGYWEDYVPKTHDVNLPYKDVIEY